MENTGAGPLRFLEMFRGNRYANLSLNQWARVDATDIGGDAPADRRGCDFLALSGQGACAAQVAPKTEVRICSRSGASGNTVGDEKSRGAALRSGRDLLRCA